MFRPGFAVVGRSLPKDGEKAGGSGQGSGNAGGGGGAVAHRAADRVGLVEKSPDSVPARGRRFRGGGGGGGAGARASAIDRALDLKPVREVLQNGLVVLVLRRTAAPVFYAQLAVRDGRLGEDVPGLNEMTGDLLEEGTTARSAEEVAAAIGAVGGTLSAGGTGVSAKTLSKDAGLALELAFEVATRPRFADDAIERVRAQQLQSIEEELDTPSALATAKFNEAVYGKGHPLGRSVHGTRESVKSITREQVVAHHARFFVPGNATLTVVSDQPPERVLPLVRRSFGTWEAKPASTLDAVGIAPPAAKTVHVASEKQQTNTYLGHLGIARKDPDFTALEVMENVFGTGSGFTDRLSKNIRDEKGLAYTVYGNVTGNAGILPGTFRVYAGTNPEDGAKAIAEMRKEIGRILAEPPTPDELAGAKAALRGEVVSRMETAADVAAVLDTCERYGLGFDWPRRHLLEIDAVTSEDVVRVAKAHVHPDAMVEVVVGPESPAAPGPGGK